MSQNRPGLVGRAEMAFRTGASSLAVPVASRAAMSEPVRVDCGLTAASAYASETWPYFLALRAVVSAETVVEADMVYSLWLV
jgi:hypothetical protein